MMSRCVGEPTNTRSLTVTTVTAALQGLGGERRGGKWGRLEGGGMEGGRVFQGPTRRPITSRVFATWGVRHAYGSPQTHATQVRGNKICCLIKTLSWKQHTLPISGACDAWGLRTDGGERSNDRPKAKSHFVEGTQGPNKANFQKEFCVFPSTLGPLVLLLTCRPYIVRVCSFQGDSRRISYPELTSSVISNEASWDLRASKLGIFWE